jgi:hypothetical protein
MRWESAGNSLGPSVFYKSPKAAPFGIAERREASPESAGFDSPGGEARGPSPGSPGVGEQVLDAPGHRAIDYRRFTVLSYGSLG